MGFQPGEIIGYRDMCSAEDASLQRGMNYRIHPHYSLVLMSVRPGSPYSDQIEEDGKLLIYEGHDITSRKDGPDPKTVDQIMFNHSGTPTQNGLFYEAATQYKSGLRKAEPVKVYEKIKSGIWVYNGLFDLLDAWQEPSGSRSVFKFQLRLSQEMDQLGTQGEPVELEHTRLIPTSIKLEVWKRDNGRCVECGSDKNLHFDHIIPYSKGGTSLKSENVQILCAKHNLAKHDSIR